MPTGIAMHLFYTMAYLLFWILAFAAITVTASDNPLDTILPRQQNISSTWPCGPFPPEVAISSTLGGEVITWAGVNWPPAERP